MKGIILLLAMSFVLGLIVAQITTMVTASEPVLKDLSPVGRVSEDQIHIYSDYIILDIPGAQWATFTNSDSMAPVLDKGTQALQIVPRTPEDIHLGDIVSYAKPGEELRIIHRVVYIGEDEEGIYYIVKGDNNRDPDPEKVRFEQIERVLFALVY